MVDVHFTSEMKAYQALQDLLERGAEAKRLFDAAGLALPAPLSRMLGEKTNGSGTGRQSKMSVPEMDRPPAPPEAVDDWIWISTDDMYAAGIVLGVIAGHSEPVSQKDVLSEVRRIRPDVNAGSIYNACSRLPKQGKIVRSDDGLVIAKDAKDAIPILYNGFAWGMPKAFNIQELAAHRRMVLLHILESARDGMQQMQLMRQLQDCGLCKAPITKDLVKADLEMLSKESKVKRISNSKKWTIAKQK